MDTDSDPEPLLAELREAADAPWPSLQDAQERLCAIREAVGRVRGRGSVRGGAVRVELDAEGEIHELVIRDAARKPWLGAALEQTFAEARAEVAERMREISPTQAQLPAVGRACASVDDLVAQTLPISRSPRGPASG